jgi:hypothetical protein
MCSRAKCSTIFLCSAVPRDQAKKKKKIYRHKLVSIIVPILPCGIHVVDLDEAEVLGCSYRMPRVVGLAPPPHGISRGAVSAFLEAA